MSVKFGDELLNFCQFLEDFSRSMLREAVQLQFENGLRLAVAEFARLDQARFRFRGRF